MVGREEILEFFSKIELVCGFNNFVSECSSVDFLYLLLLIKIVILFFGMVMLSLFIIIVFLYDNVSDFVFNECMWIVFFIKNVICFFVCIVNKWSMVC